MKNCTHCKHAEWHRTAAGKLHPSGDGRCMCPWKMPPIPASMYWVSIIEPKPCGGAINRKQELKDHCVYFSRREGT